MLNRICLPKVELSFSQRDSKQRHDVVLKVSYFKLHV